MLWQGGPFRKKKISLLENLGYVNGTWKVLATQKCIEYVQIEFQGDAMEILFEAVKSCLHKVDVVIKFRSIVDMLMLPLQFEKVIHCMIAGLNIINNTDKRGDL